MKDILKLAEETWGGLWVVDAEDLPEFDEGAKGVDGWSPAELRSFSRTHITGLTDILNEAEQHKQWPEGLNPIIALIPHYCAENEGQLRPIAILP
eukprot:3404351-Heterocapsa_arctica.AAC.1